MIVEDEELPSIPPVKAFCSYRHADNDGFSQTIDLLVADLRSLHEAETGQTLHIFFDRDGLTWGDDWQTTIGRSVSEATFFIPIVTARYFRSRWCREEFLSFYGQV